MGFNVTGQEVATGVQDPMIMFYAVAAMFVVGFIIMIGYYIYNTIR